MTDRSSTSPASADREHHWDALRALLMLFGIPYHVAMAYRAGEGWILNSGEGAVGFNYLAQVIHLFRMQAFFVIAGYFAALLLARRSPGQWLEGRAQRLVVPFVATILTLNPLLNLLCELSNFGWREALVSWERESTSSGGYWIRHLWFLIVLLYLSAIAALLCHLVPRLRTAQVAARIDDWAARNIALVIAGSAVLIGLWEGAAIELFYVAGFATNFPQQILRLDELLQFAPWFALGCVLARAPMLRAAVYRFSPALLVFTAVALAADFAWRDQLWAPYGRFLDTLVALGMTQLVIATIKLIADRPSPLVREMVAASFVIYLFHMPILAGLVVAAKGLAVPAALKALAIMGLTFALSYAVWLVVKRSAVLSLLYDGQWPKRSSGSTPIPLTTRNLGRQGL
jgi:glucan biosynthesis protein C